MTSVAKRERDLRGQRVDEESDTLVIKRIKQKKETKETEDWVRKEERFRRTNNTINT